MGYVPKTEWSGYSISQMWGMREPVGLQGLGDTGQTGGWPTPGSRVERNSDGMREEPCGGGASWGKSLVGRVLEPF